MDNYTLIVFIFRVAEFTLVHDQVHVEFWHLPVWSKLYLCEQLFDTLLNDEG